MPRGGPGKMLQRALSSAHRFRNITTSPLRTGTLQLAVNALDHCQQHRRNFCYSYFQNLDRELFRTLL
jgi:hypothetical protein